MGFTKTAIKGVSWMSGFRMLTRILAFVKIAVLARLLTPDQFGIFGIASLLLAFLEILTETGINVILIQIKDDISSRINSAWVMSILRGILISFLIIILAPFISVFFNSPEALNIILFISIIPFIRGFINPAEVKFQKDLLFRSEFLFRSVLIGLDALVSISVAFVSHSVYSLAYGLIAAALMEVFISYLFIKPRPKFSFNVNHLKEIFHKGKWITAYSIFNYFGENGDNIGVGKILGSSSLGVYQMAYKISILPISEVADVVSKVVFPVFSKIEEDKKRLKKAFLKTISIVSLGSVLIGAILYMFPAEIVAILLGSKWVAVVPVLKVLSIYGILRAVSGTSSALFLGVGKQNYIATITFVRSLTLILTIIPFVYTYGIVGAGYSALISVMVEMPIIAYLTYKVFK